MQGLRLLWEVSGVSEGTVSSCVELLRAGHVLAIAPGSYSVSCYVPHSFT